MHRYIVTLPIQVTIYGTIKKPFLSEYDDVHEVMDELNYVSEFYRFDGEEEIVQLFDNYGKDRPFKKILNVDVSGRLYYPNDLTQIVKT